MALDTSRRTHDVRRTPEPAGPRASLPRAQEPQLARLVDEAPSGDAWVHEIKYDGYRGLCRIEGGRARLLTRRGQDWTERFAPIAAAAATLPVARALLDGEIVILDAQGRSSFTALQRALAEGRAGGLVYMAFDLLHLDGEDLRPLPLERRKARLRDLLRDRDPTGPLRFTDHVVGRGAEVLRQACAMGLEGIVSKRRDCPYRAGRHPDWCKVRCGRRQEVVVGGYTDPGGSREALGALLLGVHDDDGRLVYAGRVGTGFSGATLRALRARLAPLERRTSPFAPFRPVSRGTHWVEPEVVVEVGFTEWTTDGRLRHPTFLGVREDKPAREVVREEAPGARVDRGAGPPAGASSGGTPRARTAPRRTARAEAASRGTSRAEAAAPDGRPGASATTARAPHRAGATRRASKGSSAPPRRARHAPASRGRSGTGSDVTEVAGVRLTHPDRMLWPEVGVTKLELAQYYVAVADRMLPLVAGRPLALRRCPNGHTGTCFFHKHFEVALPPQLTPVRIDGETHASVESPAALVALVQISVLEMHVWGTRTDDVEHPDLLVVDLDPDEALPWPTVASAARAVRLRLGHLGLESGLKTTGGKGLHVVVRLERRQDWPALKTFARAFADDMVRRLPEHFTASPGKAARHGRVFVDWMRNARGNTAVAPYSTRARPGAPVAVPLAWDELTDRLDPLGFTVRTVPGRIAALAADPWAGLRPHRITAAMRRELRIAP